MAKGNFYIGINGGHTKSVAFAVDNNLRNLGVVSGRSLNLHTYPHQEVRHRFENLLDKLATKFDMQLEQLRHRTAKIALSMPGAATAADKALIEVCLLQPYWKKEENRYVILDDTWAGLVAGTFSCRGICAFAGTGASIYVNDRVQKGLKFFEKPNKINGWGPIIGDFGSGFQLATDMFRLLNRELDRGNTPQLFHKLLREEPTIRKMKNAQRWFDSIFILNPCGWRIRFAGLAAVVTRAADPPNSDLQAKKLIEKVANEMIESVEITLQRFPNAKSLPITLQGGMFEHSKLYRELVSKAVKQMTSHNVYLALFRPVVGALLLALSNFNEPSDRSVIRRLYDNMKDLPAKEQQLLIRVDGHAPFMKEDSNAE